MIFPYEVEFRTTALVSANTGVYREVPASIYKLTLFVPTFFNGQYSLRLSLHIEAGDLRKLLQTFLGDLLNISIDLDFLIVSRYLKLSLVSLCHA